MPYVSVLEMSHTQYKLLYKCSVYFSLQFICGVVRGFK